MAYWCRLVWHDLLVWSWFSRCCFILYHYWQWSSITSSLGLKQFYLKRSLILVRTCSRYGWPQLENQHWTDWTNVITNVIINKGSLVNFEMSLWEWSSMHLLPVKYPFLGERLACYRITFTLSFPGFETNFPGSQCSFVSTDKWRHKLCWLLLAQKKQDQNHPTKINEHLTIVCLVALQHGFLIGSAVWYQRTTKICCICHYF